MTIEKQNEAGDLNVEPEDLVAETFPRPFKWWAYRHVSGSIALRRYLESGPNARASIEDAYESDFVDAVLEPFEAESREKAETIAREKLSTRGEGPLCPAT